MSERLPGRRSNGSPGHRRAAILYPMPDLDEVDFALGGEVADLHGVLRSLRERGPVGAVRYFGEPAWIFTTFEAVDAAYRDDDLFPAAAAFKEMTEPVF